MQKVRIIHQEGESALVEWHDGQQLQRTYVPANEIDELGRVKAPEKGIPHGDDLLALIKVRVTPERVVERLHQSGIWTIDDLLANPNLVTGAINAAAAAFLESLLDNAQRAKSEASAPQEVGG